MTIKKSKNKHMKKILFIFLLFVSLKSFADEGMWLPQLLGKLNESRMKSLGMKISAADIYSINSGSLKDAIVSFGGFCTGEIISENGLILTNHHCGFDAIQNHSTLQNNYIRDGFWSKSYQEEIENKGLFVTFIVRIDDVTSRVMAGTTKGMSAKEKQQVIDKNIVDLGKNVKKGNSQSSFIRGFFEANEYYQFVTETFNDVRLVGAPPSAIGNFGKDTDNWVWPRHTGDFSLFRIYASKDNQPADYSTANVPYKPKRSLKVSLDGVAENDFTLIFGFPGRTQQYLPAVAVEQIRAINDPVKISIRDKALKIIDQYMRTDESIKIAYASKYAGIQNAYKKWQGEVLGLTRVNAFAKKMKYEEEFKKRVNANTNWKAMYADVLPGLEKAYNNIKPYGIARDYYTETLSKIELSTIAIQWSGLAKAYKNEGEAGYKKRLPAVQERIEAIIGEYNVEVDKSLFKTLMENFVTNTTPAFISPMLKASLVKNNGSYAEIANENFADSTGYSLMGIQKLFLLPAAEAVKYIEEMKVVQLFTDMQAHYASTVQPTLGEEQAKINELQSLYMKGQMEVMTEKKFYPDANSTMRVAYGKVKGYTARDAVNYGFQTEMGGIMEKYVPGDYEFDVPQKMRELYAAKDYGQYGTKDGKLFVCFIATNHTTGGNSGSPALDASGNLIGLNFDRVWEGTMSDINFDESICRNIMVDIRYVMFVIDKFAGAKRLIDEIKFVHPKSKK